MKLIIDIPDNVYEDIEHGKGEYINTLNWAVRNGIPYEDRPKGKWINICTLPIIRKCSLCGVEQSSEVGFYDNYCPCCGAYMKGGAE